MYDLGRSRGCRISVRAPGGGRKPAWMLGLGRKRTNLHKKYDYPPLKNQILTMTRLWTSNASAISATCRPL